MLSSRLGHLARALVFGGVVAVVVACDSPSAPAAPLTLNATQASVDTSTCMFGHIVIQGVAQCLPDPG